MSGYTPQAWGDGNPALPVSAARMLVIEDGIYRAHPQVVTSLPSTSIFDGQEVVVRVPNAFQGYEVFWKFRHDSSNSTTEPWAFVGGPPTAARTDATFTTTSTSFVADGGNGPAVTVPFLGWYLAEWGATIANSGTNTSYTALNYGGATSVSDESGLNPEPVANAQIAVATARLIPVTSNNQLIQMQYAVSAGTGTFLRRWLSVTPLRCGP